MRSLRKPLGLRLAERVHHDLAVSRLEELFENLMYDPVEGINKIKIGNDWVAAITFGNLETVTETKVRDEQTDRDHHPDYPLSCLATGTETAVEDENTDRDPDLDQATPLLATRTITKLKREDTDADPSMLACLVTQTYTFTHREDTDKDEDPYVCQ